MIRQQLQWALSVVVLLLPFCAATSPPWGANERRRLGLRRDGLEDPSYGAEIVQVAGLGALGDLI